MLPGFASLASMAGLPGVGANPADMLGGLNASSATTGPVSVMVGGIDGSPFRPKSVGDQLPVLAMIAATAVLLYLWRKG